MTIEALRTPRECFEHLPGYAFAPHYVDDLPGYVGLRVHYLDEGPKDATHTFLCLHGQPSWSYLYRKMIPVFAASGARVIAPDWLGFGRSDKPVDDAVYTFNFHRDMMIALIKRLDLQNITLVVQDWGGLLGLTIPQDMPERFSRLIVMNTAIATGTAPSQGFLDWLAFTKAKPDFDVGALMARGTSILTADEAGAYNAPYPDERFKAGARRFPQLVMISPDMEGVAISKRALDWWAHEWAGETFMAVGMKDPVFSRANMEHLRLKIRGCPEPMEIADAGHFVQEWGVPVASAALASFREG
jgi:haloalkane dehalogenase